MSAKNVLSYLSYFEGQFSPSSNTSFFAGVFPQPESKAVDPSTIPIGSRVFLDITRQQFEEYINHLAKNELGINCHLTALIMFGMKTPTLSDIDFDKILGHLNSCVWGEILDQTPTHLVVTITSQIATTTVYVRQQSAEQFAFDAIALYPNMGTISASTSSLDLIDTAVTSGAIPIGTFRTAKKKSPTATINNSDGTTTEVLITGKHGVVMAGEHAEKGETEKFIQFLLDFFKIERQTNELLFQLLGRLKQLIKEHGRPIPVSSKGCDKMVKRLLLEEIGITPKGANYYIVDINMDNGRDDRYAYIDGFGYRRNSASLVYAVIVDSEYPTDWSAPTDTDEVEVSTFIQLNSLIANFGTTLKAAIPVHIQQLHDVRAALPHMILDLLNTKYTAVSNCY